MWKKKKINFDPTYKYEKESNKYAYDEDNVRVPAWTDRIFYCKNKGIKMLSYDCIKNLRYSDHRPVIGTFEIDTFKIKKKNNKYYKHEINYNNNKNELIDSEPKEKDIITPNQNNICNSKINTMKERNEILPSKKFNYNQNIKNIKK